MIGLKWLYKQKESHKKNKGKRLGDKDKVDVFIKKRLRYIYGVDNIIYVEVIRVILERKEKTAW